MAIVRRSNPPISPSATGIPRSSTAHPRPVARVTAWALATSDTSDVASDRYPPLVEGPAQPLPADWWGLTGYLGSVDWRRQPDDPSGAGVFWLSPQGQLVDGEDFALRARASIGPDGIGVTSAEIFDRTGFVGTCAQTLLVQRR